MDCLRRGWILIDFPVNREQTLALQSRGISPKHVGMLKYIYNRKIYLIH